MGNERTSSRVTYDLWPEVGRLLGLGRNQVYAAARSGQIPTLRIGHRWLVPSAALDLMLTHPNPKNDLDGGRNERHGT